MRGGGGSRESAYNLATKSCRHVSYGKSTGSSFSTRFFFGLLPPLMYGEAKSADSGLLMGYLFPVGLAVPVHELEEKDQRCGYGA